MTVRDGRHTHGLLALPHTATGDGVPIRPGPAAAAQHPTLPRPPTLSEERTPNDAPGTTRLAPDRTTHDPTTHDPTTRPDSATRQSNRGASYHHPVKEWRRTHSSAHGRTTHRGTRTPHRTHRGRTFSPGHGSVVVGRRQAVARRPERPLAHWRCQVRDCHHTAVTAASVHPYQVPPPCATRWQPSQNHWRKWRYIPRSHDLCRESRLHAGVTWCHYIFRAHTSLSPRGGS